MTDFARTRDLFDLPRGVIYLDGNSLGPLPRAARERVRRTVDAEWGAMLIGGWNDAGWFDLPGRIGDRIGPLIGAPAGSVLVGDSISVNLFKLLSAALEMRPGRKVILTDCGNFPNDLYVAQGLARRLGQGHELRVVAPEDVAEALSDDVAVLMLTEVDYRTGRLHDMADLTARAHGFGVLTLWDLAHSAGALPVDLTGTDADFAVGCGYKYLNGGPGAPAFLYVAPRLQGQVPPVLSGWMGHAAPFDFDLDYRPGPGVTALRVGTPPILSMVALDAALDVWEGVCLDDLRARSMALGDLFIAEVDRRGLGVELASPRDAAARGSQVSLNFAQGRAAMLALRAAGVVGDFRAPDLMRFGFTPLYIDEAAVMGAVDALEVILIEQRWRQPEFQVGQTVT